MAIKPQDVLVVLKLVALRDEPWTYNELAIDLGLSPSQVHSAVRRVIKSGLAYQTDDRLRVNVQNLEGFLSHGLRYLSIPERGAKSRGMATLTSAPPLAALFVGDEDPVVWPDSSGDLYGESLAPIHKSAPKAARRDPQLYELLVIADALRAGRAREKSAALTALKKKLRKYDQDA